MKSALKTFLRRGLFARWMPSAVAVRTTPGPALTAACGVPGSSLGPPPLMAGSAVTSAAQAGPAQTGAAQAEPRTDWRGPGRPGQASPVQQPGPGQSRDEPPIGDQPSDNHP